jgi:hypothetical protein
MLYIVLAIAIITICCVICVLTVILAHFILRSNLYPEKGKPALNEATEEKKAIPEPTEEQKRKAIIFQQEVFNLMNYNGDTMPDPKDIAAQKLSQSPKGV